MRSPLLVVTGTGTGVGKTHASCIFLRAWARHGAAVGYKPIETGVPAGKEGPDARKLRMSSSFHVKLPPAETFAAPLSPHLAAARCRKTIPTSQVIERIQRLRQQVFGLLVELPGGLFTPLAPNVRNADLLRALDPTGIVAVAPDRLGVLHDVGAMCEGAAHMGLGISGIVLNAPRRTDASTGTNANEIEHVATVPVLLTLGRTQQTPLAAVDRALARLLGRGLSECVALAPARLGRGPATRTRGRHG